MCGNDVGGSCLDRGRCNALVLLDYVYNAGSTVAAQYLGLWAWQLIVGVLFVRQGLSPAASLCDVHTVVSLLRCVPPASAGLVCTPFRLCEILGKKIGSVARPGSWWNSA